MHQYQVLIDLILIVILDVVFYGTHYTGARYLFELGKSIYLAIYQLQMEQIQDLPRSNSLQPDVVFYIRGFEYILGLPQQKNYLELFLSRSVLKRSEPSAVYKKHISRFFEYSSQITYSLGHELLVGQQGFFFHLGNFDIAQRQHFPQVLRNHIFRVISLGCYGTIADNFFFLRTSVLSANVQKQKSTPTSIFGMIQFYMYTQAGRFGSVKNILIQKKGL